MKHSLARVKYSFSGKLLAVQIAVAKRLLIPTHINLLSRNEAWKFIHLQRGEVPGTDTISILRIIVGIRSGDVPTGPLGDLSPWP